MSLPVMVWVLENSEAKLGARLVLLALAEFAHDDGSKAFPSNATLMRRTRLSERGVRDALRALERDGMIRETGKSPSGSTVYTVLGPFNEWGQNLPPGGQNGAANSAPDPRTKNPSEPNGSAHEPNGNGAQALVAHFVDASVAKGANPPRRVVGQIAKLTGELLAEGIPPERITAGMDRLIERGLHPAVLPAAVHEAAVARSRDGPAAPRKTGWRFVRGSHGSTYVQDPDGTDTPPKGFA